MCTYRIIAKQLREQLLEVVVILSTQVAHLSVNNIPRALLISVGGAGMASRQHLQQVRLGAFLFSLGVMMTSRLT